MSVDVPIKSQGDPSCVEPTHKGDPDPALSEWKSISSTSQDTSQEKGHAITTISHDTSESRHQVFGYNQRMGNGLGDQGGTSFNPLWSSPGKTKKFKKTKWNQSPLQQFPPVSPQSMPGNINSIGYGNVANLANQQAQNWPGTSQQWQKGHQDSTQGPPYFGGQFVQPTSIVPPCNLPPPGLTLPHNFPVNIPPPNFLPPGQPSVPFTNPAYSRPPPPLQANIQPGSSRFTNPPPQQSMFAPHYPPPQVPAYPSFSSPGAPEPQRYLPKSDQSPSKKIYTHFDGINKDTSPLKPSGGTRRGTSPSKPKKTTTVNLPSNWKTATDPQGNIYYYHTVTR